MQEKKHRFSGAVLPLATALIVAITLFPLTGCDDNGSSGGSGGQSIDGGGEQTTGGSQGGNNGNSGGQNVGESENGNGSGEQNTSGSGGGAEEGNGGSSGQNVGGSEKGNGNSGGQNAGESENGNGSGEQNTSGSSGGSQGNSTVSKTFTSIAEIKPFLDAQAENDADHPYNITVTGIDVSTTKNLPDLYTALSRFVNLDLSDCIGETFPYKNNTNKSKIVSIVLPETVTIIAKQAFSDYSNLKKAELPSVKKIMESDSSTNGAFYKCISLVEVHAPNLEIIGNYAFYNCAALKTADFPNATEIGKNAFKSCDELVSVNLPNVQTMESAAFTDCKKLSSITTPNLKRIEDAGTTASGVFSQCGSLTAMVLPNVEFIGDNAFYNCDKIVSITLGDTVPDLGGADVFKMAKNKTPKLTAIYVPSAALANYEATTKENWTSELKALLQGK
jgi:hypothetical protein